MYVVLRSLLLALLSTVRTRASLQFEILALRHQLGVLQRTKRRRVQLGAIDRLLWVALRRLWPEWRRALVLVKPDTVIAWLAPERILSLLEVEEPPGADRTSGDAEGDPHSDP